MPYAPVSATIGTRQSRHVSVFIGGKDVTAYVVGDSLEVEDCTASGTLGTCSFTLNRTIANLPELSAHDFVRVVNHDLTVDYFRGFVTRWQPVEDGWDHTEISATDHGTLLDRFIPGPIKRPAESDRARIGFFWGIATPSGFYNHALTYVQSVATVAAATYVGTTLRRVLDEIAADASSSARWYLDQAARLHYYTSETNAAPYDITSDVPGASEIGPRDLVIDYDAGDYRNTVYVNGGNAAGSGWVYDRAAIAKCGIVVIGPDPLDFPSSTTAARRDAVGLGHLAWFTSGMMRGSFTAYSPDDGWMAGQTLNVRSAAAAVNGATRIVRVRTKWLTPTSREYSVEFGSSRRGFAKRFRR